MKVASLSLFHPGYLPTLTLRPLCVWPISVSDFRNWVNNGADSVSKLAHQILNLVNNFTDELVRLLVDR